MRLPIVESRFFVFGLNVHFLHIVYTYVHTYIHRTENLLLECMIILLEMSLQAYQEWRGSVTNIRCMALDAAALLGIYILYMGVGVLLFFGNGVHALFVVFEVRIRCTQL